MKRTLALLLLAAVSTFGQSGRLTQDPWVSSRQGNPVAGATIAVCQPLATTAASLTSTIATFTMASNPVMAGYVQGMLVQISGFTGADTYFNQGTLSDGVLTGGVPILSVTTTQIIAGPIVHANGSASSTGYVLQLGNSVTPCAGISSIYADTNLVPGNGQANPFQADGLGNYSAGVLAGTYYVQIYGSGIITTMRQVAVPSIPSQSGVTAIPNLDGILYVDGVKYANIAAADTALGAAPGEIWYGQASGASIAGFSLSANHVLRFIQGGTYSVTGNISLGQSAGIVGEPSGMVPNATSAPVILQQAAGSNLNALVTLNQQSFLRDITIDGNKAANTTTVCVVGIGIREDLQGVNVANCPSHNIQFGSTGINVAAGSQMSKVMSLNSGGSALFIQKSLDITIDQSQFENATRYGIEGTDAGEIRMVNSDVGGNLLGGINATCTQAGLAAGVNAIGWNVWGNQFGNNNGSDIFALGTSPSACLYGWDIVGNSIIGPSATATTNSYDAIHLDSGGRHTVTGNVILNSIAGHVYRYMISVASTNLAELTDIINSNIFDGVAAGTGTYNLLASTWYGWNQNFSTPGHTNTLSLDGSSSGSVTHVAPAVAGSNTITDPAATGIASLAAIEFCGATSGATQACAKTVQTNPIIVFGDVTLNTATTQAITTLPFTAAADYSCSGSDLTTPAGIVSFPTYTSGAQVTIQETGGANTDHLRYMCVGF